MKTFTKRELNRHTAKVLAEVHAGEPVLVAERGVARWRITAIDADAGAGAETNPIEKLRAQGQIIPAKEDPMPWPETAEDPRSSPAGVDRLHDEMGDNR